MSAFQNIQADRPRTSHLEFIREMHRNGAPLGRDELNVLFDSGDIPGDELAKAVLETQERKSGFEALDRDVLSIEEYIKRCEDAGFTVPDKPISKGDWAAEDPAHVDQDYAKFIASHLGRFCDLVPYEPFYLWLKQGMAMLAEGDPDTSDMDKYTLDDYHFNEWCKFRENLYFALSKYGRYKESSSDTFERPFTFNLAHSFIAFLIDAGRSGMIGKPRQIASTTLLMLIAAARLASRQNFHCKLIACDLSTTEEIFEDKLKYGFGRFPKFIKPKVINDAENMFRVAMDPSADKGSKKALTSRFTIVAPKVSAINGGAPDIVFVDEAPFLPIFDKMMAEGWPTIFVTGTDGKLKMKRQFWAWGTGGRAAEGGGSFEVEHRKLIDMWLAGDYSKGLTPLFLDWTCRPGISKEFYLERRKEYLSGQNGDLDGEDADTWAVQFRQHYPSSIEDMYSLGGNTLMPSIFIIKGLDKINALPHEMRPIKGRFEPVYDFSERFPAESFLPHPIKGVNFVPASDMDLSAPVEMFQESKKNWKDRYYQGTDPITTATGYSNFASAIYDCHYKTIPCIVDGRTGDPYDMYLQGKLMGMYYAGHGERFCPELIEDNAGSLYIKWMRSHEWRAIQSMVTKMRLPDFLQTGDTRAEPIGINTSGNRKPKIVSFGKDMLMSHGANIYQPKLFHQLKSYVGVSSKDGKTMKYGVDNYRKKRDDVIDAVFFAFICRMAHANVMPQQIGEDGEVVGGVPRSRTKIIFDERTKQLKRVLDVPAHRKHKSAA